MQLVWYKSFLELKSFMNMLDNKYHSSKICLGTWRMGGDVKPNPNNDDEKDIDAIKYAISKGISHIDTSESYADGKSELLVGEDQVPHIEVTRLLAKRFNAQYGQTLYVPKVQQVETLRIRSLKGEGKMSKTNPNGAIFLTDSLDEVAKKIKKAETAFAGEMSPTLASHVTLAKNLTYKPEDKVLIDEIIEAHMQGQTVMGDFKKIFTEITLRFIENFQQRRVQVVSDPTYIPSVLEHGARKARNNADETLSSVYEAMTSGAKEG